MGVMPGIRTVLFDLGGVLTGDPWQAILLTPRLGIADRLGLDHAAVEMAGELLWARYCLVPDEEQQYWSDFRNQVGREVPAELVCEVERETLHANPFARQVVQLVERSGISWGFISDNTAFWFRKQMRLIGIEGHPAELDFVSFNDGASKTSTTPGLFEIAAGRVIPRQTLVIDDQQRNVSCAHHLGFRAALYSMARSPDSDLIECVRQHLEE
jgi:beta-phosphoglucomutase-like phosphatase (HAD superfamily)